MVELIDFDN